ncbi:hypothetical protein HKX48_002072 [Thoreauomyces humboldtii]|nr:hypothetical protein HKX48_002072 [Thoreauomyces humboldtii]
MTSKLAETDLDNPQQHRNGLPPNAVGPIDPVAEAKLLRKLDIRIMPWLCLLYLLNFLNRANVGNAKIANTDAKGNGGLYTDLGLVDWQYNLSISIFFIGYILFEIPSNLLLKKFGPSRWLGRIIAVWGCVALLQFVVKNAAGLLAIRFFLGVTEAGFLPGVTMYLTFFYRKEERAKRLAIIIAAAALSGAFGGLLAYGISFLDHHHGLRGWQWIFLLEGIPTIVAGILTFWVLPDFPDSPGRWLSPEEKLLAVARLDTTATRSTDQNFNSHEFGQVWKDWRTYFFMAVYICVTVPFYSMSYFLPTLVKGLGYTSLSAQLMSVPPFGLAFFVVRLLLVNRSHSMIASV